MADRLLGALSGAAARLYGGEAVSELEHALQCADLARDAGADEELELACLLHDVGRWAADPSLISDRADVARVRGAVPHSILGAELIAPWVPARVTWCVRMHADAKRYLCATDPAYYDRLSPASRHTLGLQGGLMSAAEVAALSGHPWLTDALRLRRWDDEAKVPGTSTRALTDWAPLLRRYFAPP